MIQRIQTLYIFLASAISLGLIFIFPLWKTSGGDSLLVINLLKEELITLKIIPILFIFSGLMSIVSLFLFKKRKNQFVLNRINILINFILLGVLLYYLLILPGESTISEKGIGVVLPIIVIVLLAIANKSIKRDEDLVKSVDRLR